MRILVLTIKTVAANCYKCSESLERAQIFIFRSISHEDRYLYISEKIAGGSCQIVDLFIQEIGLKVCKLVLEPFETFCIYFDNDYMLSLIQSDIAIRVCSYKQAWSETE